MWGNPVALHMRERIPFQGRNRIFLEYLSPLRLDDTNKIPSLLHQNPVLEQRSRTPWDKNNARWCVLNVNFWNPTTRVWKYILALIMFRNCKFWSHILMETLKNISAYHYESILTLLIEFSGVRKLLLSRYNLSLFIDLMMSLARTYSMTSFHGKY